MPEQHHGEKGSIPSVTPKQAWQLITEGGATLIDVREPLEYTLGHAEGALSIPLSVFAERYQQIPRTGDILLICHVGQRSLTAAEFIHRQGWQRVFNVEGGTDEWQAMKLPMRHGPGELPR